MTSTLFCQFVVVYCIHKHIKWPVKDLWIWNKYYTIRLDWLLCYLCLCSPQSPSWPADIAEKCTISKNHKDSCVKLTFIFFFFFFLRWPRSSTSWQRSPTHYTSGAHRCVGHRFTPQWESMAGERGACTSSSFYSWSPWLSTWRWPSGSSKSWTSLR